MLVYLTLMFTVGTAFADNYCSVCADVEPIENIDCETLLIGKWYQYYRYKDMWEDGAKCVTFAFNYDTGEFNVTAVKDKNSFSFGGYYAHHKDKGILVVCSDAIFESSGTACLKINILKLKFLESVLFYSCHQDEKTGDIREYAWGFTRKATLEGDTKNRVEKFFNSTRFIDPSKFIFPGHSDEDCCTD